MFLLEDRCLTQYTLYTFVSVHNYLTRVIFLLEGGGGGGLINDWGLAPNPWSKNRRNQDPTFWNKSSTHNLYLLLFNFTINNHIFFCLWLLGGRRNASLSPLDSHESFFTFLPKILNVPKRFVIVLFLKCFPYTSYFLPRTSYSTQFKYCI